MPRSLSFLALAVLAIPALAQRAPAVGTSFSGLNDGVAFVENRGQWPDEVLFRADLGGGTAWVTDDGVVFDFFEVERGERDHDAPSHETAETRRGHVVAMRFEGGRARQAVGRGRKAAYHNYFLGADPARWATRVPLFEEVVLGGLYDGVDLRLYDGGGRLRYDLVVAPGADPSQIRMRMEEADGVSVMGGGALQVRTALGPVEHRGLLAYQDEGGRRERVVSSFVVEADGVVGFDVRGADLERALVIDPLIWSTFLGGSNGDSVTSVDLDAGGHTCVFGNTRSSDFPATSGAYDASFNGGSGAGDAFVARLSADGSTLLHATYLGGGGNELAYGALGPDGSATLTGWTESTDFPTTPGAFDTSFNGGTGSTPYDAFVARLSADGSTLLYGTFLGGASNDFAGDIAVGVDGSATVVGQTSSSDFPTTPGAYGTSYNGGSRDGFVAQLSADGSSLLYSTFLGGSVFDSATGVVLDACGSATVVGQTSSSDFPATPGAYDTSYNGGTSSFGGDAFAARLSADGSALLWATYLGGAGDDSALAVSLTADGEPIIAGETESADFPTTPGAFDTSYDGFGDAFVARLSADGSALRYATFLGGRAYDSARALDVGSDGRTVAVGVTESVDFPTTSNAFDPSYNGGSFGDGFAARVAPNGGSLLYSTFLGGTSSDFVNGVTVGADGTATVVGYTLSPGFPVTPGAYDTTFNSTPFAADAFVARLDIDLPPFAMTAEVLNSPVPRPGELLLRVALTNSTEAPIRGDVILDVVSQYGFAASRVLLRDATLPPGETATPLFALRVVEGVPLGLYDATVTALEGGTTNIGEAHTTFRVIPPEAAGSEAAGRAAAGREAAGEPWSVAVLDDGGLMAEGTSAEQASAIPAEGVAVWPNPAADRAAVAFMLEAPSAVRLALYDVLGREVIVIDGGRLEAGTHRLGLDLSSLPAGVYVWRLDAGGQAQTGRLTVAR